MASGVSFPPLRCVLSHVPPATVTEIVLFEHAVVLFRGRDRVRKGGGGGGKEKKKKRGALMCLADPDSVLLFFFCFFLPSFAVFFFLDSWNPLFLFLSLESLVLFLLLVLPFSYESHRCVYLPSGDALCLRT